MEIIYKIDSNIPIPKVNYDNLIRGTRGGTKFTNTLKKLEINESFAVPVESWKMKDIHSKFSWYKKRYNKAFTARTINTEIRIWRIK